MLDIRMIRERAEETIEGLLKKGRDAKTEIGRILELDRARRDLIAKTESMKAEQNQASKEIARIKKEGGDAASIMARMKEISGLIADGGRELTGIEGELDALLLGLPNLPDADLLPGGKENNRVVSTHLEKPEFDFEPQNHVDLCTNLKMIDYPRGAKIAGSGFWLYRGFGARMEWALLNYFIDTHIKDGYEMILPPHLLAYESGLTAGQFPKFEEDVFWLKSGEDERKRFLLPTAETALVSMHQGEILEESALPCRYIAYTPCYRREAGSYRSDERGMIRGHQFNKVEMVQYTRPEDSDAAFSELVTKAENLMKGLGLHFQTVKLAAGDCSASMARTFDIEVYIPSMGGYKEVSSASNARDYQARRGQMRFKRKETGKTEYLHTLNASGLATSRLLPAIAEQFQTKEGHIRVPEALQSYLGCEIIGD